MCFLLKLCEETRGAFYSGTDRLKEVGTSEDGGKTIKLK